MNIVYIHQHFSTARGATGTRSYDFARMLQARGHRVTVVCGVYGPSDIGGVPRRGLVTRTEMDGLDVRIVNIRYEGKQSFAGQILAFLGFMVVSTVEVLRIPHVDVVFATSTPLTVGLAGTLAKWFRRTAFVFEVRDIWPEWSVEVGTVKNPLLIWAAKAAARFFYHEADRIVVISHQMGDLLGAQLGPAARKIRVVPLGTDCALFAGAEPDLEWRRRHGLDGKFVVVYAGAHNRLGALDGVLDAAAFLREDRDVRIVLIGDGPLKPRLVEKAASERLENVLMLDPMPKEQLAGVLRTCDLGLMTIENLSIVRIACPNKFMDYLAAGLPVLVNFDGEVRAICEREGCGVFVPPEDPQAMADAIRRLARDPERSRAIGRRAAQVAAEQFDRARLVEDFERVLEEARHGRRG
jgi:glycosyltransferase involved in cell wall biosynthesis